MKKIYREEVMIVNLEKIKEAVKMQIHLKQAKCVEYVFLRIVNPMILF